MGISKRIEEEVVRISVLFFFSSRRRHTRLQGDWSSDVCSSDLLEATVYYVVAESITNAVKHAQASTVAVRAGLRDGAIEVEIRDDGVGGADPRQIGRASCRERV